MSFFRPSFLRSDPFFAPTLFPRPTFPSLFDFPSPVSAPLYTLYDVDVVPDDLPTSSPLPSSSKKSQQAMLKEEKYPEAQPPSKASPSPTSKADSRVSTRAARGTEVAEGRKAARTSLFSPLPSLFSGMSRMDMTIDMFSTPTAYNVHASVPGLDKKDISITVDDRVLSIEAERREEKRIRRSPNTDNSSGSSPSHQSATANSSNAANATSNPSSPVAKAQSSEAKYPTEESARSDTAMPDATAENPTAAQSSAQMEDDGVDYHHVESFYGRVSRRVQLPEDARVDELTAKYEDGIIKITVPRAEEQKRLGRRIEVQ